MRKPDKTRVRQTILAEMSNRGADAFRAYLIASRNLAGSTFSRVDLLSEDFDSSGLFDPITGRYSPGRTGYYALIGTLAMAAVNAEARLVCRIRKNGADTGPDLFSAHSAGVPSGRLAASGIAVVRAELATDYFEFWAFQNGATQQLVGGGITATWVAGHRIGDL